jgi:hypothetical protein
MLLQKENEWIGYKLKKIKNKKKIQKKYAPALDNYGQSCFARSDF